MALKAIGGVKPGCSIHLSSAWVRVPNWVKAADCKSVTEKRWWFESTRTQITKGENLCSMNVKKKINSVKIASILANLL